MPSSQDGNSHLRNRALRMLDEGKSLHVVLHFVRERLPQTRSLASPQLDEINSTINQIVDRRRRKWLDNERAVDKFFESVQAL